VRRRRVGALAVITWLYILWSLAPVLIAVRISFNSGRSRSTFQSASFRWYWQDEASVWRDEALQTAL
jgi:spermidine/putrescine transport system permease protein